MRTSYIEQPVFKEEQRLALIKIKEQIAQDRAERSQKFNQEKLEREEKRKEQERLRLAEEAKKAEQLAAERRCVNSFSHCLYKVTFLALKQAICPYKLCLVHAHLELSSNI